jgi:leucyl-tRNA synthetase
MKEYDPKEIETKWQKDWEKRELYHASDSSDLPKYYTLIEFPYPSGDGLHVGHPRPYIGMDVVSRKKRMDGFNVLYPIGWDAFGLPTENYAIKTGKDPRVATKENSDTFKRQIQSLGISFDWSREINTTDPKYYKWTQWIFLKFLEKGLAYKARIPINWCPQDKIGLANEEVVDGKCERCGTEVEQKEKEQWMLAITKYADRLLSDLDTVDYADRIKTQQVNWIGKSEGAEIEFPIPNSQSSIKVFTTRPDTIYGATFLVKAGQTDRFTGEYAVNPATGENIPVWEAEYVLADYGTGAIMGVPAHDERDWEFAKKHDLPIKQVVMQSFVDHKNPPREGKENTFRKMVLVVLYNPKTDKYLTLKWKKLPWVSFITGGVEGDEDRVEAAKREVAEETGYTDVRLVRSLGLREAFFFAEHKDVNRKVHGEHFLFELVSETQSPVAQEESEIHEAEWLTLEELKKTNVQHAEGEVIIKALETGVDVYSGEGIVVNSGEFDGLESSEFKEVAAKKFGQEVIKYKLRDWVFSRQRYWGEPIPVVHCDKCGIVPVPEKDLPVTLPEVKNYQPTENGDSPLANISEWVNTTCPKCGGRALRETDVMPNWAGSSWYFLRYADPHNDKEFASLEKLKYWTPIDWYNGGMEHTTLHLLYSRFWHKFLFDLGLVPTSEPYKKRTSHGLILAEDGRKMSKSLGNVINPDLIVARFGADTLRVYEMFMGPFEQAIAWSEDSLLGPRRFLEKVWKLKAKVSEEETYESIGELEVSLNNTVKKVSEDIESLGFNTAISSLMIIVNALSTQDKINKKVYETILLLTAPFAPHMTEELWQSLGHTTSIHKEAWPSYDKSRLHSDSVNIVVQVDGKVRAKFAASRGISEKEALSKAQELPEIQKWMAGKEVKNRIYVADKLVNFVTIDKA